MTADPRYLICLNQAEGKDVLRRHGLDPRKVSCIPVLSGYVETDRLQGIHRRAPDQFRKTAGVSYLSDALATLLASREIDPDQIKVLH